jgi:hypothetical protein
MRMLLIALIVALCASFSASAQPWQPTRSAGTVDVDGWDRASVADPWNLVCGATMARGSGTTTVDTAGIAAATVNGTAASVTIANTNAATATPRIRYTSATTADALAGWSYVAATGDRMVPSNTDHVHFRVVSQTIATGQALYVGIQQIGGSAAGDPSAQLHTLYMGCDASQANLQVCSNDGSGTATCTDLGASFPCKVASETGYDFAVHRVKGTSNFRYIVKKHDGTTSRGTITADLPSGNIRLRPIVLCSARASGAACVLELSQVDICSAGY